MMNVSPEYLEEIYKKVACGSLDMHDPTQSTAEIFRWHGKAWVATGGVSKGNNRGAASVDIREVVPLSMWRGPFNDLDARGLNYYTGGRFHLKRMPKEIWVITDHEVTLRPDSSLSRLQAVQLEFA